jgi:hypothetical protein
MGESLPRSQPLFMIEANPQNDEQILRFLGAHGYTPFERSDVGGLVPARPGGRPLNWFYATEPCRRRLAALFQ